MELSGRTALVVGGTGALGQAVCLTLLGAGARVVAAARGEGGREALLGRAGDAAARLAFVQADLADAAGAARAVEEASRGGALDAVVNTAGGWAGGAPLAAEPAGRLAEMLAANLTPAYTLARAAAARLARRGGAFVQVASLAAAGPQPGQASYAAAKAAVLSLCQSLAEELRPDGVRVNVVLPGTMDTPANRRAMPDADRSGWARLEDVAAVVLFLCSDASRAVTGAALTVRGSPAREGAAP